MILAIDIGLRNLAMCIMDSKDPKKMDTYKIHLWEVFNTLEEDCENYKCTGVFKNNKECGRKCSMKFDDNGYVKYTCKAHFPKNIPVKPKNIVKVKKVDEYLLQDIARIVLEKVTDIYNNNIDIMKQVKKVIIELQPKVNNKMKLISHIIYGKFVEFFIDQPLTTIRFVRASQKLKAYKGPAIQCNLKGAYAKRKYLSIQYTSWFLANQFNADQAVWTMRFNAHPKKDDLADTFLMAVNGVKG